MLALLTLAQAAEFHPGPGPEFVAVQFPLTGLVLAAGDAAVIAEHPGVASVSERPGGLLVVVAEDDPVALSNSLWAEEAVQWAHPDFVLPIAPHALPNDPYFGDQWHLVNTGQRGMTEGADIRADVAWELSTGEGQLIAVLDSGVLPDHPDLDVIPGWDYIGDDSDPSPDTSTDSPAHGTNVAGLSAALGDNGQGVTGVAYDARIYAIRLIGGGSSLEDVYDAFTEAVDAGAVVINNSWGFHTCGSFDTYETFRQMNRYAEENGRDGLGTVVVASAGNDGCDASGDGWLQQRLTFGVAASDGHDEREGYSNYGDVIDITGPSGSLLTTDLDEGGYGAWEDDSYYYGWFSGTSGSAPVVSGVFALMFDANERLSAADAREVICDTATRIDIDSGAYDASGWSPYYGCGRVDAGAAVFAVANDPPLAPSLLGPEDPWVDRVLLEWEPALDADGDWLEYELTWSVEDIVTTSVVDGTRLDLTGLVELGQTVTWSVTPVDLWGPGASSEEASFVVQAKPLPPERPPEEPGGCGTAPLGGLWLSLLLLRSRLTRSEPSPGCARSRRRKRTPGSP